MFYLTLENMSQKATPSIGQFRRPGSHERLQWPQGLSTPETKPSCPLAHVLLSSNSPLHLSPYLAGRIPFSYQGPAQMASPLRSPPGFPLAEGVTPSTELPWNQEHILLPCWLSFLTNIYLSGSPWK